MYQAKKYLATANVYYRLKKMLQKKTETWWGCVKKNLE